MPTNKQRREAARRHLERQLERRQAQAVKRKQRNLILTIVGTIVVVAVVVVAVVMLTNDNKKSPSAAASASSAASPSASASASSAPLPKTAGPCGYTQTGNAVKNVGFPPDPSPTPTTARTLNIQSNLGPIAISLDAANAPCNVQSVAFLATQKYYDNTKCFRLVTSGIYVLQCGDAANNGTGTPGYETKDENLAKADYSKVGTVAMANAGAGTNGSQFFIVYKDSSANLGKNYTVIGSVTSGMDLIQKVVAGGETDTDSSNPGDGAPKTPLTFVTVTSVAPVVGHGTMVTPSPTAPASGAATTKAPTGSTAASPSG